MMLLLAFLCFFCVAMASVILVCMLLALFFPSILPGRVVSLLMGYEEVDEEE